MKAIILAAGYGTRLYPLTENKPKALLDVGGKTILERLLEKVQTIKNCDSVCVVSNSKFYEGFLLWQKSMSEKMPIYKNLVILDDGTTSNETRLGAIGDINFALDKLGINDDILVMGSDNLFKFNMVNFMSFADSKKPAATIAFYDIGDISKASLYGIAKIKTGTNELVDFQEKPKEPESTLAATAIYYYPKPIIKHLKEYMAGTSSKDAPGNFVKWLISREKVYGYVFKEKWYDIGDIASLKMADSEFAGE